MERYTSSSFSPCGRWKPYPPVLRHTHGVTSQCICDPPLTYPFDEAYNACKNSLLNFAYSATNRQLDRRINDSAHSARKNFPDTSGFPSLNFTTRMDTEMRILKLYSAENLPRLISLKAAWDPKNF